MKRVDIGKKKSLLYYSLFALCGICISSPMLVPSLAPLTWFGAVPVILFETLSDIPEKLGYFAAWRRGFCFFFFFGFISFSWFCSLYPLDFLGFTKWESLIVVICAVTLIPAMQAAVSAFIFVFVHFMRRCGTVRSHPILLSLSVSFLFPISEWLQNFTFLAIPWGKLAMTQTSVPEVFQSASLFGSYFVSFLIVFVNCLLSVFLAGIYRKETKWALLSLTLALALFMTNFIYGTMRIKHYDADGESVRVAALQGNIRFEERRLDKADYTMDVYKSLALSAASDKAELIVYPETAIPYDYNSDKIYRDYFCGMEMLTGKELIATFFQKEDGKLYNTAHVVTAEGVSGEYYSKTHLVPFGEYLPMEGFINTVCPPLAAVATVDDPVSATDDITVLDTSFGKVGCLICFDSIFDDVAKAEIDMGAELLCISTNDSWFEGSVALTEHEFHSILRAVETGRYTVRAANTGISAVISPTGDVISSLSSGKRGYITADVKMINEKTLYCVTGNIFIPVCALGVIIFTANTIYKRKKK